MKILFILDVYGLFGNPSCGASNRNTLFVKALTKLGHVDVCSFSGESIKSDIEDCVVVYSNQNCGVWEKEIKGNKIVRNIRSVIQMTISPTSPYAYYQTCKQKEEIIDELVKKDKYDFIACRYIFTAIKCGLLKYNSKLLIDIDDNPANSLMARAATSNSLPLKLKLYFSAKQIHKMVENVLEKVFCSFYSNILEPPSPNSVFLHNSAVRSANIPDISQSTQNRIIVVGNLGYPPNRFGVSHFVSDVFSKIRQRIPDVELRVIGKGDQGFLDELNSIEGVNALGFVEDIITEYKESKVVIIPIYHGSGTCVKFVEGMFMNRPIVSTPIGARGFDRIAKDKEHFLLANNDEEFADKTIELLLSRQKSIEIANKGYELAKNNFSQEKFMDIVKDTIETKLKK